MMNTLQVDPTTGEVFLRLPAPHENIIITPPRESDVDDLVLMLNDPRIYKFLLNLPFPYHPHHAEEWLRVTKNKSDKILTALREGETVVDGFPVQYIQEVQPDGTGLLLGDFSVTRHGWRAVSNEELRAKMTKENSEKPVGDPSIVWTIGGVYKAQWNTGTFCDDIPQTTSGQATTAGESCPQQSAR
jgi:RimJ/RimL family protein N-acetyltransferase